MLVSSQGTPRLMSIKKTSLDVLPGLVDALNFTIRADRFAFDYSAHGNSSFSTLGMNSVWIIVLRKCHESASLR